MRSKPCFSPGHVWTLQNSSARYQCRETPGSWRELRPKASSRDGSLAGARSKCAAALLVVIIAALFMIPFSTLLRYSRAICFTSAPKAKVCS